MPARAPDPPVVATANSGGIGVRAPKTPFRGPPRAISPELAFAPERARRPEPGARGGTTGASVTHPARAVSCS